MTRLLAGRWGVAGAAVAVALVTALVFLLRAGDPGGANWPVEWELRSSDNGVLFQVVQDLFAGRPLDWSFSPQVYVFPELPISVVAFVIAGGSIYGYYLAVASLNGALLFLALYLLLRTVSPRHALARAALASVPLVFLPLVGTSWLVSFHLAPTYYIGMYLVLFAAPSLFFVRGRLRTALLAAAIALTLAANPLGLVFAGPAFAVAIAVKLAGEGWRGTRRSLAIAGAVVLGAAFVRIVVLTPLQGRSPFDYMDADVFAGRLKGIEMYFRYLSIDSSTAVILTIGLGLAVAGIGVAIYAAVRYLRSPGSPGVLLVVVYFGLLPLLGIGATYAIMITHYLYTWPVFIAPFVLALLLVRGRWVGRALAIVPAVFLATVIGTGSVASIGHPERYFGYRAAETTCIDTGVPEGTTTGYATFSDARRLSLTSARSIRLVPLERDATVSTWLTNREYPRLFPGSFFYINERGDELAIDTATVVSLFGEPDSVVSCGDGQQLLIYTAPVSLAAIAAHYENAGQH